MVTPWLGRALAGGKDKCSLSRDTTPLIRLTLSFNRQVGASYNPLRYALRLLGL